MNTMAPTMAPTVAPTTAPLRADEIKTQAGTQLIFDRVDTGWVIKSGRAEAFLIATENGKQSSKRHFILEARTDDIVMPVLEPIAPLQLLLITPEPTVLVPFRLDQAGAATLAGGGLGTAKKIERWIASVAMATGAVIGVAPDRAQ